MLYSDRPAVWLGAAAAAGATLWLVRRRAAASGGSDPLATGFEAYLKNKEVGRKPEDQKQAKHAPTSFEAYLRQPAAAPASGGGGVAASAAAPAAPPTAKPVTLLYGTEYGFSKEVAERAAAALRSADGGAAFWPSLLDMADLPQGLPSLPACQALLVVCSTQGDGVPPTEARDFCDWLASGDAPALGGAVRFSVCALGDRSYQHFCRCGRTLDARLEALGGARLAPRVDVNKEDLGAIDGWIEAVLGALRSAPLRSVAELGGGGGAAAPAAEGSAAPTKRWSKSRPFMGRVVAVEGLCTLSAADDKNTVRVEVDLGDSGLRYTPGDALGVWPSNCPQAVDELLGVLGADGGLLVQRPPWHYADPLLQEGASSLPLRDALARCYDLRQPRPELLRLLHAALGGGPPAAGAAAGAAKSAAVHVRARDSASELSAGPPCDLCADGCLADRLERLAELLEDGAEVEAYLAPRHVVDVLRDFRPAAARLAPAELLGALRQLQPRLYSISSSQLEHPQRVQATVAIVRYESLGAPRLGVCSTYVGERLAVGQEVPVYIHKNPDFRLPADPATPIMMVGPGTGLAPFRAFMQERILAAGESGAAFGPCLLYFGCRRRDQDFLYGPLLERWAAEGRLELHTAFSREQARKVYVQDRLAESGARVWELLQAGGHFYVCGDAGSMAGAVEAALLRIIEEGQGRGAAAAQEYLAELAAAGRYQRDVWLS